jgi:hypothetical protein
MCSKVEAPSKGFDYWREMCPALGFLVSNYRYLSFFSFFNNTPSKFPHIPSLKGEDPEEKRDMADTS